MEEVKLGEETAEAMELASRFPEGAIETTALGKL